MVIRSYFNERAETWDVTVAEKDSGKLRSMVERLHIASGAKVLDVGTGTGVFLPFLLEEVGENGQIVAIDVAEKMLCKAQSKNLGGNTVYICADVIDIPLEGAQFDAVVCYSSFPHFQDKLKAMREINRVMKNGGRLHICHTASRAVINEIHENLPVVTCDTIPGKDDMQKLLSASGFTDISINDNPDSYLCQASKQINPV